MLAFVVALELRWIRGAVVRDVIGPAVVALTLSLFGSGFLSRTTRGGPRVPFATWLSSWLRFLGLMAAGLALAIPLFVPWTFVPGVLRLVLLGVAGALPLAMLGRLASRPPKPPPITSPGAR
jgi:hypothetical protein